MTIKSREEIEGLRLYTPGKPIEKVKKEYGIDSVIKLASNENPLGPSPKAVNAIKNYLNCVSLYPDSNSTELKQSLAKAFNVNANQILPANGSDELTDLLAKAFIEPDDEVIMADITMTRYYTTTLMMSGKPVIVPLKDWTNNLDEMLSSITNKTKMICLCNPNNPTGTIFNNDKFEHFLSNVPKDILVVCDESYREFVEDPSYPINSTRFLSKYNNLVIIRTFTKIYGLAGLRIGYGISSPNIIEILNKIRCPFNVNLLAQTAATAAIDDTEFVKKCYNLNIEGKSYLYKQFDILNLEYQKTESNHIWVKSIIDSTITSTELQKKGVIIRPFGGNWFRVSIGTMEQNEKFIFELKNLYKK